MTDEPMEVDEIALELIELPYEQKLTFVNSISRPLANRKLAKRLYKLLKSTSADKTNKTALRISPKYVQKFIKRGEKGLVILAGNVTPIDTYSHIPILCEENKVPYVFVPCKEDLQTCLGTKSQTICVMVNRTEQNGEGYAKCVEKVNEVLKEEGLV